MSTTQTHKLGLDQVMHPWLYNVLAEAIMFDGEPRGFHTVVGHHTDRAKAEERAEWYRGCEYANAGRVFVVEPTEPPRSFASREELVKAAKERPVTLYTIDCPLCGADVTEEQTEYSATREPWDYLDYHCEEHHSDLPETAGETS